MDSRPCEALMAKLAVKSVLFILFSITCVSSFAASDESATTWEIQGKIEKQIIFKNCPIYF